MKENSSASRTKPPLQWSGVLFALAANLLLVTVADMALPQVGAIVSGIAAPLIAGALTARYTQQRGGMHAFLGGMISIPILGGILFPGLWQMATLAGAFCTLGGTITELALRRR